MDATGRRLDVRHRLQAEARIQVDAALACDWMDAGKMFEHVEPKTILLKMFILYYNYNILLLTLITLMTVVNTVNHLVTYYFVETQNFVAQNV